jgi:hypothetical protein
MEGVMAKVDSKRAQSVLTALIDGVHPETGAELAEESVLQDVVVVRSLLIARGALEAAEARTARRALLPRGVGRTWSADEERELIDAFKAGQSINKIAADHSRTVRAIEARLERLGRITAAQRFTSNNFFADPDQKP